MNSRQTAIILAALRHWQGEAEIIGDENLAAEHGIYFDDDVPLIRQEVDALRMEIEEVLSTSSSSKN
jgi:hypothetical protein